MSPLRRPWIRPSRRLRWISSLDSALLPLSIERLDTHHDICQSSRQRARESPLVTIPRPRLDKLTKLEYPTLRTKVRQQQEVDTNTSKC